MEILRVSLVFMNFSQDSKKFLLILQVVSTHIVRIPTKVTTFFNDILIKYYIEIIWQTELLINLFEYWIQMLGSSIRVKILIYLTGLNIDNIPHQLKLVIGKMFLNIIRGFLVKVLIQTNLCIWSKHITSWKYMITLWCWYNQSITDWILVF